MQHQSSALACYLPLGQQVTASCPLLISAKCVSFHTLPVCTVIPGISEGDLAVPHTCVQRRRSSHSAAAALGQRVAKPSPAPQYSTAAV